MKSESVGDVARTGGLSRLMREVEETGNPIKLLRNNDAVAMICPADEDFVQLFEGIRYWNDVLTEVLTSYDRKEYFHGHLVAAIINGNVAKAMLGIMDEVEIQEIENEMISNFRRNLIKPPVIKPIPKNRK